MKTLTGKIVSIKQSKTVVVEVKRKVPHPLYKKLLTKSKKFQADAAGIAAKLNDTVVITEIRPVSKNKYFKLKEIIKKL